MSFFIVWCVFVLLSRDVCFWRVCVSFYVLLRVCFSSWCVCLLVVFQVCLMYRDGIVPSVFVFSWCCSGDADFSWFVSGGFDCFLVTFVLVCLVSRDLASGLFASLFLCVFSRDIILVLLLSRDLFFWCD